MIRRPYVMPNAELIDGRFRVLRTLGQGASARVLLVEDRLRDGQRLALKQLASDVPRELLEAELEALASLTHPNLVRLHDLELRGERPYLTLELVEGPSLCVWAAGRERESVLRALRALVEAVALLHSRGWVHGDLKPENVLVDGDDRPRLCDLGLARRGGGLRAGTAGYAAPEVILGGGTSARADVYALGVIALEALAGRRAFGEDAAAAVERQARGESVLDELVLPAPLSSLLRRCLERDPARRPASAGELLPLLDEVGGLGPEAPSLLPEPALQGRADALAALDAGLAAAAAGTPGCLLLVGGPGLGKTRLLGEARLRALSRGLAAPRPTDLRALLAALATAAGGVEGLEPSLATLLAGLLPSLGPGRSLPSLDLTTRLRAALHALAAAACARRPHLILLDDVDRLEPLERDALLGVVARLAAEPRGPALFLLLAARTAEGPLAALPRLELAPLDDAESEALLRSMRPTDAELPCAELARLAAGNPLLLAEGLRAWLGASRADAARSLDELARARLAGLEPPLVRALEVAALGPELDAAVLSRLAPLDERARRLLLDRRLLRERSAGGRVLLAVAGDHLRRVLADGLAATERRARHLALAEALEAEGTPPEEAALHWERAGERARAADRYLAAARHGFDFRGRFAARAAELGTPAWPGFGEATRLAARALAAGGEAAAALDALDALRAQVGLEEQDRRLAAELAIILGDPARALAELEPPVPGAELLGAQACYLLGRREEAATLCARLPECGDRENLLGLLALDSGELGRAAERFAVALERYRAAGDRLGLAKAENNLAIVAQRRGDLRGARACFTRAIEHSRGAGDPVRAIHGQINRGTACQLAGEAGEAIRDYEQAVREAGSLGSPRLEAQARLNLATLLLELGDGDGAEAELGCCAVDDGTLGCFVHANRADLALLRQDLEAARRWLESAEGRRPYEDTATTTVELFLVRARLLAARGEHAAAAELADRAAERAAEAGEERLADEARLAAVVARRRAPDAEPGELRRVLEGVAARMGARGERGRLWRVHHELSLAEALLGRELEAGFHRAKARQEIDALLGGLAEAQQRALLGLPDFREVYAATRALAAPPDAATTSERAAALDGDTESLLRISLDLGRVRDPGELVQRALERALEVSGAQRGLLCLLEGERLQIAASRNLDPAASSDDAQFSTQLARDVISSGRAVCTVDASADDRFRHFASVSNLQLRSVLCVPLTIWGAIAGVIYLDNPFRAGVFSPRRIAVLEGLAAQAGLALDTARLLDAERRRSTALSLAKQKVDELTAQLQAQLEERSRELGEKDELVRAQERQLAGLDQFQEIVGRSPSMRRVLELCAKTAAVELPVYIYGESGTGKELIARALHRTSPRRERPLVTVNCGGLPPSLLQSELFGHVRGAFTGAVRDHAGLFRLADRGTIFLDEVTEMSPDLQVQLLRVLQTGTFRPVGGERELRVDVRVISASNLDLDEAVRRGGFRDDLRYRLNVLRLDLPPLRERREDIPLLCRHFLGERAIERAALRLLQLHDWPGNVRELANELARASAFSEGTIRVADLSPRIAARTAEARAGAGTLEERVASFERELLREALAEEVKVGEVARRLGLSRAGLYKKLGRHRLPTRRRS